jgi:hypothetical protein
MISNMKRRKKTVTDRMLQFFSYSHLPEKLQEVSKPFGELAHAIVDKFPANPERTAGLRKLLEAKDCIVRSTIYKE